MSSLDESGSVIPDPNAPPSAPEYDILEEIARSGLTTIYRARDIQIGREVAIKVHQSGVDSKRLLREAHVTVRLEHPGIVSVRRVGQLPDGRGFMAMELIKGDTLAHVLRDRASPSDNLPQLVAAFEQVCRALEHAHTYGVIHRN